MQTEALSKKNLGASAVKEALYISVHPMLWGTITQQFLLYRGASPALVGVYATLVMAIQMAATVLLSTTAERVKKPLRFCTGMMLLQLGVAALFLPAMAWDFGSVLTVVLISLLSVGLLFLHSCKTICDYKIHYQIVSPRRYGTMMFLSSAISGAAGILFTGCFSWMIDSDTVRNPYLMCMLLTLGIMAVAVFFNSRLKPIYPVPQATGTGNPWTQLKQLMRLPVFRKLIVPNFLRGITLSLTGCIVLIALVMGIDESGRAKLPLVCALATACASVLYLLLEKKLPVSTINILGGVLTCAMIFLPRSSTWGFLCVYFVAYLGRTLVDSAVPTMLFPLIDPKIAGSFNAWRSVLFCVASIVATPIISALVEIVHPLWLLIPGSVTYLIVTVWYWLVCRQLKNP